MIDGSILGIVVALVVLVGGADWWFSPHGDGIFDPRSHYQIWRDKRDSKNRQS